MAVGKKTSGRSMDKLTNIKPTLGGLSSRYSPAPRDERERDRQRSTSNAWRIWYKCPVAEASPPHPRSRPVSLPAHRRVAYGQAPSTKQRSGRSHHSAPWRRGAILGRVVHDKVKQAEELSEIKGSGNKTAAGAYASGASRCWRRL